MAPITEHPRVTVGYGTPVEHPRVTVRYGTQVEHPRVTVHYGPPVAPPAAGRLAERPPVATRYGPPVTSSTAGQVRGWPQVSVRSGPPVVPPVAGRMVEWPRGSVRSGPSTTPPVVGRAVIPAARHTVAPIPPANGARRTTTPISPATDHRSATTGYGPVPGLPAVAGRAGTPAARRGASSATPRRRPRHDKATRKRLRRRVHVAGLAIDPMTETEVVDHVIAALKRGEGGHLVTPNADIGRIAARDPLARGFVEGADLVVADGMPLVWAARLLGTPLPGRVTGADLIWSLSEAAAFYRHPVYLLGGPPGVAARAARELVGRHPKLQVAGVGTPPYGFENDPGEYVRVREAVIAAAPRLVFVGLGFPRQERLIASLRRDLPGTWFVGCGSAIAFAAGSVRRAPVWMRRGGLEWVFRLAREPGRLGRRYLLHDLPYALGLLAISLVRGLFS